MPARRGRIRDSHRLGTRAHMELLQHFLHVLVDGCDRYAQPRRDLLVGSASAQLSQNLLLPDGQSTPQRKKCAAASTLGPQQIAEGPAAEVG